MRLRITERYQRSLGRVPDRTRRAATQALAKCVENPRYPGLNLEQLSGWQDTYSIRGNRQYRILLVREVDETGELFAVVDIGTHKIYRR
jgi:mRNA-degrading endonuclease RelE of RelBE toxin-antitoxin system